VRDADPVRAILAIDQSTSATKAILLDDCGKVLDSASREHRQHYPQPGWVEHDAEEIWANLLAACSLVLERSPGKECELSHISIANQRETIVVFERRTGRPLHPAVVWQCRRGTQLCARQAELGRAERMREKTGLLVDTYFSASKLQWLIKEHPDLAARLRAGEALIGTMDTYLIHRLTNGTVFATDHTNASRTLLYDIHRLRWDEELCDWWEVPGTCLAEVRPSDATYGETTLGGLLEHPVPIRGVMGDSQAALFGHGCFETGSAKVTFGTGSSVLLNVGKNPPTGVKGSVVSLAWVTDGAPVYALEGIITCSAGTLTWLRDQLGVIDEVAECETLARSVSGDEGVYVVPAFAGLAAPYWQAEARAAIVGLTAHSDRRHVVRAGLESMAYQVRDVLEMMREESGVELREIHADGGPAANRFLMQFVADIVGVNLRVATRPDQSAVGAAMMGARGSSPVSGEVSEAPDEVVYTRAMEPTLAEKQYAGWRRAVGQVLAGAGQGAE
jgi:glycerol kinase